MIFDQGLNYVLVKSFTTGLGVVRHLVLHIDMVLAVAFCG